MQIETSSLESLFINLIDQICEQGSVFVTRSRDGIFGPALTMWLMINGWAKRRRGLAAALEAISAGEASQVIERNLNQRDIQREFSESTGGFSRARKRLELQAVTEVSQAINDLLIGEVVKEKLWGGRRVFLFDGTTIALTRNDSILAEYSPSRNQHREAYTPSLQCGVCHELFSGIALNPRYGAYRGSGKTDEVRLFCQIMQDVPAKSLLIADRALGILPVAYEAECLGHQVLVRLTAMRAKSLLGRSFASKERIDEEVTWRIKSKSKIEEIPEGASVSGRFIKWTVTRNGFRPLELLFFTTSQEPAKDLVKLYQQRERIENDIRTLKHTIGLERLFSKSPDMIAKELLLGVVAYNLIRAIICQAAEELGLEPRDISFTRAAGLTQILGNKMRAATTPAERKKLRESFLLKLYQTKHPNRKRQRIEPRKSARIPQSYPPMKESRASERQKAQELLEENGHRGYFTSVTRNF